MEVIALSLNRRTLIANSVKPECLCVHSCAHPRCQLAGQWHNHSDEVCPVHPDTVVD